jgi:signal transduction histidine kinase
MVKSRTESSNLSLSAIFCTDFVLCGGSMKHKEEKPCAKKKDIPKNADTAHSLEAIYAKLKATEGRLAEAEKFRAIGQLASGIAHEIRNPLAILVQCLEFLEAKMPPTDKDAYETISVMKNSIARANNIITILYDFSGKGESTLKAEDVNSLLEESLSAAVKELKPVKIDVARQTGSDISKVLIDRAKMEQVFINIISNAIQAMPEGGKLTICTYEKIQKKEKGLKIGSRGDDLFKDGEKAVIIQIQDTGTGISEEDLKKVSVPFFTTFESKKIGKGPGLGLPLSKSIVGLHRGMFDITSKPGQGTKITIALHVAE